MRVCSRCRGLASSRPSRELVPHRGFARAGTPGRLEQEWWRECRTPSPLGRHPATGREDNFQRLHPRISRGERADVLGCAACRVPILPRVIRLVIDDGAGGDTGAVVARPRARLSSPPLRLPHPVFPLTTAGSSPKGSARLLSHGCVAFDPRAGWAHPFPTLRLPRPGHPPEATCARSPTRTQGTRPPPRMPGARQHIHEGGADALIGTPRCRVREAAASTTQGFPLNLITGTRTR